MDTKEVIDELGAQVAADVTGASRAKVGQWRRHNRAPSDALRAMLNAYFVRKAHIIYGNGSELARLLGVSRQSVWQWRMAECMPDRQQIRLRVLTDGELIPTEETMTRRAMRGGANAW